MSELPEAAKKEEERQNEWICYLHLYDLEEKFPYSHKNSPVHPEIYTEIETRAEDPAEAQRTNVSENTTKRKKKKKKKVFDEKPWLRPGADISDYFNYGFDEETWDTYRKKHIKLGAFRAHHAKLAAWRKQVGDGEEPSCSYSSSNRPSILDSRELKAVDVSGGRDGCGSTKEGQPYLSDGASQVVSETAYMEDSTTSYSLMPLAVNNFACFPPLSSSFQPTYPSLSFSAMWASEHYRGFDGPSTSGDQYFSGHGRYEDRSRSRSGDSDNKMRRCSDTERQSFFFPPDREKKQRKKKNKRRKKKNKRRKKKPKKNGHKDVTTEEAPRMMAETGTDDTNTSKRKKKREEEQQEEKKR